MRTSHIPAVLAAASIILIALCAVFAIEGVVASNAPHDVIFTLGTVQRNVNYCNSQTLDIYTPRASTRALPLAIFVHGGGMSAGDKSDINAIFLNALANAGFVVASVNYRLAPQYKYPSQIEDVKCAIRYLRDHAQLFGINPNNIFAFGASAGGELVTIAALTGGHSSFDVGPYLNESSSVTAVVDMFGPANLTNCNCYTDAQRVFGSNPNNYVMASPTHYIAPDSPPILIIQGVNDTTVSKSQSIGLYDNLVAAGDQTQLILVQNMGHMFVQAGSEPISPSLAQIAQDVLGFFGEYTGDGSCWCACLG